MKPRLLHKNPRPSSYPPERKVLRGCIYTNQATPEPVFITSTAKLHNLSGRRHAAVLQVAKINTLAAGWMIRDIGQRKPEQRFAHCRKDNSTRYQTDLIARQIDIDYRARIRSRYTLNSDLFHGLCAGVASIVSSYLQQVAEARKRGLYEKFAACSSYIVRVGRHTGEQLGSLGRRTVFGYACITPKREACEEALRFLNALLVESEEDRGILEQARAYRMSFGPHHQRPLGNMREETLRRLKRVAERYVEQADQYDELRRTAQEYLRFTPPSFPQIRSDGLSPSRRRELHAAHIESLNDFAALPDIAPDVRLPPNLTRVEHRLFRQLQQYAHADANTATYVPLRWQRADACVWQRACGLVYDHKRRRYLFIANILAADSRHRRVLTVHDDLVDVNNPGVKLRAGQRPSGSMLFELEFARHQQAILDAARQDADRWKEQGRAASGCVRSAQLQTHTSTDGTEQWFEVQLAIGIKPDHIKQPEHVVGVHIDPFKGWFVTVLALDGTLREHVVLDEQAIARWLNNKQPEEQAAIPREKRTTKEAHHRVANALVAICDQYQAQLGIEDIRYRTQGDMPGQQEALRLSTRAIIDLVQYKLARANLPACLNINNLSPKRDCSQCGHRHPESQVDGARFRCPSCGADIDRYRNSAYEVARRTLWVLARKTSPQKKAMRQRAAAASSDDTR